MNLQLGHLHHILRKGCHLRSDNCQVLVNGLLSINPYKLTGKPSCKKKGSTEMSDGVANAKRGRLRIFIKSPDYRDYCRDPELKKKPFPKFPSFKLCRYHCASPGCKPSRILQLFWEHQQPLCTMIATIYAPTHLLLKGEKLLRSQRLRGL